MKKRGRPSRAVKSPRKVKKTTDAAENIGKVLVNLGQVVFGTLFLGAVLNGNLPHYVMMVVGIIATIILISLGIMLSAKVKPTKE